MGENRHIGILGTIITVIILILLILLTNVDTSKMSYFKSLGDKISRPIQVGFTNLKNKISGNDTFFATMDELKEENKSLKEKNEELSENMREYEVIKAENELLKEKMNLTEKYSAYQTVSADVINKDISNYGSNLVLNVGSNDGIKEKMTVISDQGLVGYILKVSKDTSTVRVITDPASRVSCNISTTNESVMCQGTLDNDQTLRVTYIPLDADVIVGDSVETSGVGQIYARGIHIGIIKEIITTTNQTDRYAIVETAVDFSKLNTVLVITSN